jgi:hypothetical protein
MKDNIKTNLQEIMSEGLDLDQLPQDNVAGPCRDGNVQLVHIMRQKI